jgi:predicted ester cyclase
MDRMIDEHFRYEANDDVEGVLSTLADHDLLHDIVGWPDGPSRDKEGARAFYRTLFADLDEGRVESLMRLYGDGFVVDESMWEGRATGRPFGLEGGGRPLKFRLLHVFEFTEEGRIRTEKVWLDMAAIVRQLS